MRQKVLEFEQIPVVKYTEYTIIAIMIIVAVIYSLFQTVLYRSYLDYKVATDETYTVFDEEHNVYSNVVMSDDLTSLYKTYLDKQFKNLPLYENDYAIVLTDDVLTSMNPYTTSFYDEGYFITANTNAIRKTIVLDKGYITTSFHHEVGHAVDNAYKFSETDEFEKLYNQIEHDDYLTSDIGEYFAEGYARFLNGEIDNNKEKDLIAYYEDILDIEYNQV